MRAKSSVIQTRYCITKMDYFVILVSNLNMWCSF